MKKAQWLRLFCNFSRNLHGTTHPADKAVLKDAFA